MKKTQEVGRVIAAYGRHYGVMPQEGGPLQTVLPCFVRVKEGVAVGDWVHYERCSADQGLIVSILPRRNLLYRSEGRKSRRFAANLDQVLIMLATAPRPNEVLLGRTLVASQAAGLSVLIVLNKIDLEAALPLARESLQSYKHLGYPILELSLATQGEAAWAALTPHLAGRTTLVLGQSGTGKSTLINHFIPHAKVLTREISQALGTGKHTTTATHFYDLGVLDGGLGTMEPKNAALIDSPGFQAFGLDHLSKEDLEDAFVEFQPLLKRCRFYNCRHLKEPDCAIRAAVQEGQIEQKRYKLYQELVG